MRVADDKCCVWRLRANVFKSQEKKKHDLLLQYFVAYQLHCCFFIANSLLASGDFCRLLITFAKSLDPDQDQHSVSPDLDPNSLCLFCRS